jgi:hypothetical protein
MAYDTELADRIRFLIGTGPGLTEKKMFGGLAFLIAGNMAISASGQGGALIRVDPADCGTLTETTTATPAIMGGREMRGWLRVSSDDLETDEQLTQWISRAVSYARPPAAQTLAWAGTDQPLRSKAGAILADRHSVHIGYGTPVPVVLVTVCYSRRGLWRGLVLVLGT